MRAAVVDGLETIPYFTQVPEPSEVDGALRIKVQWAGLQPTDVLRVRGTYKNPVFPYIIGGEGVGLLEDGRRVYFGHSVPQQGAMSEITMVPRAEVWPIPDDIDARQVIALALAGLGALIPLEEAGIQPGERVLILGATGPVGQIGALAARQLGAGTVIGAARSPDALERMKARGILDDIVQLGQGDDDGALAAARGPNGYNVVLDPLFGAPAEAAMRSVAEGGRLMSIGTRAGRTMTLTLTELRRRHHHGVDTGELIRSAAERQAAFERLLAYAKVGNWVIDTLTYDLEDVQAAWAAQCGSPHAKIIIKVSDDGRG
jgi:NADPH:quinone reductase